jgi:hypothetical protein
MFSKNPIKGSLKLRSAYYTDVGAAFEGEVDVNVNVNIQVTPASY